MRKLTIITIALLAIALSTALPLSKNALGTHQVTDVRDCTLAGQGPNCVNIYYEGALGFTFLETWDPSWDYETLGGSFLGGLLYDQPVLYNGAIADVAHLAATSAIKSIDNANGTHYTFTINTGIHAYRCEASETPCDASTLAKTPTDLGVITEADWVYSIQRSLAVCNPDGPAPVVYPFVLGAQDWFNVCLNNPGNQTVLSPAWTTFLAQNSIKAGPGANQFTILVDADFNTGNGQQAFTPFLGVLANSWAVVYSKSTTEAQCGALLTHLAETCAFMDSPKSIGTGPYLWDEAHTDPTVWYMQKNPFYCQGDRAASAECDKLGPVKQSERPSTLVITEIADETSRAAQTNTGLQDHSSLAPVSYPNFLKPTTTPVFNELYPDHTPEFNFVKTGSLTIQHLELLVNRTDAQHTSFGTSQLEGFCPGSSGCLVRQALRTVFNYANYVNNIVLGLGTQLSTFMPDPFGSGNTAAQACTTAMFVHCPISLITTSSNEAVRLLLAAGYNNAAKIGGTGKTIQCTYNVGNDPRARACISLANSWDALRSCNNVVNCGNSTSNVRYDPTCTPAPKTCTITNSISTVAPPTGYISKVFNRQYDIAGLGWFPDYVDEDDYARPYAYSTGTFQGAIGYTANATLDAQIDAAAAMTIGSDARRNAYFGIEHTINNDCQCYIFLQQPQGRSIWNAAIDTRIFTRLVNPAFLPYYLDLHKIPYVPVTTTPVFDAVGAIILTASVAVVALVLFRRTSTRKITPPRLV